MRASSPRRLDLVSPGWRGDDVAGRYEAIHDIVSRRRGLAR
jgi:hypothetical protein